jgi:hypothetical protein
MMDLLQQLKYARSCATNVQRLGTNDERVGALVAANPLLLTAFVLTHRAFIKSNLDTTPFLLLHSVGEILNGKSGYGERLRVLDSEVESVVRAELGSALSLLLREAPGEVSQALAETIRLLHLETA